MSWDDQQARTAVRAVCDAWATWPEYPDFGVPDFGVPDFGVPDFGRHQ